MTNVFFFLCVFQEIINSAFQDIVSDELKKIEDSHDILWEYKGPEDAYESDSEEILLEMQRMFYSDLITETAINGKPFTFSASVLEDGLFYAFLWLLTSSRIICSS